MHYGKLAILHNDDIRWLLLEYYYYETLTQWSITKLR